MTAKDILLWPFRQVRGLLENAYKLVADTKPKDVLPAAWLSTLVWIRDSFPRSLGFASNPQEQVVNVVIFTIVMVLASLTALTYVAVFYFTIFFPIALLRFWPVVDEHWPVSPKSWPLWSVKTTGSK